MRPEIAQRWGRVIDDVAAGRWISPDTGRAVDVPFKTVLIADTLAGAEADLVRACMPARRYAVVCDEATHAAQGAAIAAAIGGAARTVVLDHPHADENEVEALQAETRDVDALIAVGSGTINDICKYSTFLDGRPYCVFGTAPSMNGYTSVTASITLRSGLKTTKMAHAAKGTFIDLTVNAAAPAHLIAAGFGDSLCRAPAQVDWYFSHRMFGTPYYEAPYAIQAADEAEVLSRSRAIGQRDVEGIGYLQRLLTLVGLGVTAVGMSHPASMGEHQISHWIASFAGGRHPGTTRGTQVGVTAITMLRLQSAILSETRPPRVRPTVVDEGGIRRRYPAAAVEACLAASRAKALDQAGCDAFNDRLAAAWPELRGQLLDMAACPETLATCLREAGGGTTAAEIGMDRGLYRDALRYAPEIRDRYSLLDLAAGMGVLDDFIAQEVSS